MAQSTPWAILLTKWNDNNVEPRSRQFFEELFTTAGTGSFNMTDFFDTMSHGSLDLSGSKVFGWFTLDQPQTTYVGNAPPGPGQLGRSELLTAAKAKAQAGGVDLAKFFGVVVCMNTLTDLCGWQGGRAALCDPGSFEPTVLGQEMGHGYGLQHSRVEGSTADYQDPWDTMSTWNGCYYASDPNYTLIGPGLNAANMRNMGWLDEARVWQASDPAFNQQIELRPLHARGLPGNLAAEIPGTPGGFLLEFRVAEDWDVAIPRAAVFVHRLDYGTSYRMLGSALRSDLGVGDMFTAGLDVPWSAYSSVRVDEINAHQHYAKLTVSFRPRERRHIPDLVGEIFGGVAVDGSGILWIGGKPHPVDPWGPLKEVSRQLVAHEAAAAIADPLVRLDARKSALTRIVAAASAALGELTALESPPARTRKAKIARAASEGRPSKAGRKRAKPRK